MTEQLRGQQASDARAGSDRIAAAFGAATAITVVFNVVLAFFKEAYEPLNRVMAQLTGHHWITHGLADILVFVVLGWLFAAGGIPSRGLSQGLVITVAAATVIAGAALAVWFALV
jgi:hypothetical protein